MMLALIGKLFAPPIKVVASISVAGVTSYLFPEGVPADALIAACVVVVLDLLTGVGAAWMERKFDGSAGIRRTLLKVLSYLSLVLIAAIVPRNVPGLEQAQGFTAGTVLTLIILTEAVSIIENVRKMGFSLPFGIEDQLKKRLRQEPE
jgi:toxin secretion/phage lysis holin